MRPIGHLITLVEESLLRHVTRSLWIGVFAPYYGYAEHEQLVREKWGGVLAQASLLSPRCCSEKLSLLSRRTRSCTSPVGQQDSAMTSRWESAVNGFVLARSSSLSSRADPLSQSAWMEFPTYHAHENMDVLAKFRVPVLSIAFSDDLLAEGKPIVRSFSPSPSPSPALTSRMTENRHPPRMRSQLACDARTVRSRGPGVAARRTRQRFRDRAPTGGVERRDLGGHG